MIGSESRHSVVMPTAADLGRAPRPRDWLTVGAMLPVLLALALLTGLSAATMARKRRRGPNALAPANVGKAKKAKPAAAPTSASIELKAGPPLRLTHGTA